jgi:hypothetical protein
VHALAPLQALVAATPQSTPVDFRAIHAGASRVTQAAYEGWKKAALVAVAPTLPSSAAGGAADLRGAVLTRTAAHSPVRTR